jgi:RNA polymerase sigma-70 factor (family 1)
LFNKTRNTETNLIRGLRKGKHDCFRLLFERYSAPLYHFSLSYLKSKEAAEDVVQDVFIKIWYKRKEIKTGNSFQAYLFTIGLNVIRKHFQKLDRANQAKHDILISLYENGGNWEEENNYQEKLERLESLIYKMPERRRDIFLKRKIEGKSLREIAGELDISSKTVEYHITEAMKFLNKRLKNLMSKE